MQVLVSMLMRVLAGPGVHGLCGQADATLHAHAMPDADPERERVFRIFTWIIAHRSTTL